MTRESHILLLQLIDKRLDLAKTEAKGESYICGAYHAELKEMLKEMEMDFNDEKEAYLNGDCC